MPRTRVPKKLASGESVLAEPGTGHGRSEGAAAGFWGEDDPLPLKRLSRTWRNSL